MPSVRQSNLKALLMSAGEAGAYGTLGIYHLGVSDWETVQCDKEGLVSCMTTSLWSSASSTRKRRILGPIINLHIHTSSSMKKIHTFLCIY